MATISSVINNVIIEFKDCVINDVDERLIDALTKIIRPGVPYTYLVSKLFISSAKDSHQAPSNHVHGRAVDISRINGKYIYEHYGTDPEVTELVQRIQDGFETINGRRENFGPYFKHKSGQPFTVSGHHDHIHLSIDE